MEDIEVFKYNTLNDDLTRAKIKYNELKQLYEISPTEDLFYFYKFYILKIILFPNLTMI
jgi:hypothetical protein